MLGLIAKPYVATDNANIGTQQAAFPRTNMLNNDYGRVFRSGDGAIGGHGEVVDLGSAKSVDTVAVLWHNLRSTDTIVIKASNTAGGAGDLYTSAALQPITGATKRDVPALSKFLLTLSTPVVARYWTLVMNVVGTVHPDGYVQASRFFVGDGITFQIGPQRAELGSVDFNQKIQLETGEDRSSEDSLLIRPVCQLDLSYAKQTEMDEMLGRYSLGSGTSLPLLICPDLTDAYLQDQLVFGRPENIISLASDSYDAWKFQARVRSIGP